MRLLLASPVEKSMVRQWGRCKVRWQGDRLLRLLQGVRRRGSRRQSCAHSRHTLPAWRPSTCFVGIKIVNIHDSFTQQEECTRSPTSPPAAYMMTSVMSQRDSSMAFAIWDGCRICMRNTWHRPLYKPCSYLRVASRFPTVFRNCRGRGGEGRDDQEVGMLAKRLWQYSFLEGDTILIPARG